MIGEPTVFVIDDDQAVRDSLQFLLESADLRVRTFASATEFLAECDSAAQPLPGCLVVDVRLPGITGLELQEELRRRNLLLPAIVITGHGDIAAAVRAMKAGAVDFIEKPFNDDQLLTRIREAMGWDERRRRDETLHRELAGRFARLTPREKQVMGMVVRGNLNKQIASELNLSTKTVEVHRAHVMEKMEARSLADLVRYAILVEAKPRESGVASAPPPPY